MKMAKRWLAALLLCTMAAGLLYEFKTEIMPQAFAYGQVQPLEGTWAQETQESGRAVRFDAQLPGQKCMPQQILLLQSHWGHYRILVDGEEIFRVDGGRSGSHHLLPLPPGEQLTVQFLQVSSGAEMAIRRSKLFLGDKSGTYRTLVRQNLHAVIFAAFALALGAMGVVAGIYTYIQRFGELSRNLMNLGLYILCAGTWVLTDSGFLMLVTRRTGLVELISFYSFFLLPIPLLGFTKKMLPRQEKVFGALQLLAEIMLLLFTLNALSSFILTALMVVTEHVLMGVAIALVLLYGYREVRRGEKRKLSRVMQGYFVFALFSGAALCAFYRGDAVGYSVAYVLGMLGFIICLVDAAGIAVLDHVKESEKAALYAKMVYVDMMTGLGNRAAFQARTQEDREYSGPLGYIMLDANNLKTVNDTLGHQRGDELIAAVAGCIQKAVGEQGACYRIGGDEFVICLKGGSRQQMLDCMKALQAELRATDAVSELSISAAMGYAWAQGPDKDLEQLLRQADDNMYQTKKEMKEQESDLL